MEPRRLYRVCGAREAEGFKAAPVALRTEKVPPRARGPGEVRPLAPVSVERMRAAAIPRDAALFSVMAYGGLRPGEALALRWGDIRENTLLIERAVSLGTTEDTKTRGPTCSPLATGARLARLPEPRRPRVDGARLPVLAPAVVRRRPGSGRRHQSHAVLPAPLVRLAAAARGTLGHLRGAAARARRPADPHAVRTRDRRARRQPARQRRRGHPRGPSTGSGEHNRFPECSPGVPRRGKRRRQRRPRNDRTPARAGVPRGEVELGGLEPPTSWVRSRRSPN